MKKEELIAKGLTEEQAKAVIEVYTEAVSYTHLDVYKRQVINELFYPEKRNE